MEKIKIVIKSKDIKVPNKLHLENQIKNKHKVIESKKVYNRKKLKNTIDKDF